MTSTDSPRTYRRLRVRRSAAFTGAAFVGFLAVSSLALALMVEQPFWAPLSFSLGAILLVSPVAVSMWAWRTGIDVTVEGITVRRVFGSREIPWPLIDGFATGSEGVQAILADQSQVKLNPLKRENLPQVLEIGGQEFNEAAPAR